MAYRDLYSNLKFFQAIPPAVYAAAAMTAGVVNGPDVDTKGYEALAFAIEVGDVDISLATSNICVRMQHTDASALGLGPSAYADVSSEDIIHSTIGFSTGLTSGIIFEFSLSGTSMADLESVVYIVGYRGDKRYVRLVLQSNGTVDTGSMYIGATAILGTPAAWPVNDPA